MYTWLVSRRYSILNLFTSSDDVTCTYSAHQMWPPHRRPRTIVRLISVPNDAWYCLLSLVFCRISLAIERQFNLWIIEFIEFGAAMTISYVCASFTEPEPVIYLVSLNANNANWSGANSSFALVSIGCVRYGTASMRWHSIWLFWLHKVTMLLWPGSSHCSAVDSLVSHSVNEVGTGQNIDWSSCALIYSNGINRFIFCENICTNHFICGDSFNGKFRLRRVIRSGVCVCGLWLRFKRRL